MIDGINHAGITIPMIIMVDQKILKTVTMDFDVGHSFLMLWVLDDELKKRSQNDTVIETRKAIEELLGLQQKGEITGIWQYKIQITASKPL